VELPEALVHAVDLHADAAPPARLVRRRALGHDDGADRAETAPREPLGRPDVRRQLLAEEAARRGHDLIRLAEPLQKQLAQTRPHRLAHHQRARQHRHRRAHAAHDGQVRPPVVNEIASEERDASHKT
jgi:hypothetical protein